jgi:predicted signal transduction protein with EAL and GGDEF domain
MYQAKQQGRDMCAHFNEGYKVEAQRRNMLEQALRLDVRDNAIQVVFQPVVDVVSERVGGHRSAWPGGRWTARPLRPASSFPLRKKSGLIGKLGYAGTGAQLRHGRASAQTLGHHVAVQRQLVDEAVCRQQSGG